MTLRLSESDQGTRSAVKCTCPHTDLLTAHQGPVFCPFSCFHQPSSIQDCPALVLTLWWKRHNWEQSRAYYASHSHTQKCAELWKWLYLAISRVFFHWSSKRSWRKGNKPLKCITPSNLLLQLYSNDSFVKRTFIKWRFGFFFKHLADNWVCF